jgi:hypothetical protein
LSVVNWLLGKIKKNLRRKTMYEHRNAKGELHRTDGPAIKYDNGDREWWVNGKRHRTDGPAVVRADYYQEYWQNNKLHRTDGPAVIHAEGYQEWWVNGKFLPSKQTKEKE